MKSNISASFNARHAGRVLVVFLSLLATACGLTEPTGQNAEAQKELTEARSLWRSQGLNDYSYVFTRSCFCVPEFREPVIINVRGGAITSVVSVAAGTPRDATGYQTVEGLFGIIQKAIDDGAASIRADYDPARGYLISAYIDLDTRLADEEISIEAKSLTPTR